MTLYDFNKLSKEEKIEELQDNGELIDRAKGGKSFYSLHSFYVITRENEEEEIVSIRATLEEPSY